MKRKFWKREFSTAADDKQVSCTSKISHPNYRLAYDDDEFLLRDELRATRLQLEWLKPDLIQNEHDIESTVVIFGSARIEDGETSKKKLNKTKRKASREPENEYLQYRLGVAKQLNKSTAYYEQARLLAKKVTKLSKQYDCKQFVVVTGGGPGIMKAANQGAHEAGGKSVGLNIVLPFEQTVNSYVTKELCFQFHYFAVRKMHFLKRARALIVCPGGLGTMDELFETLTLIQTKKVDPIPVILLGKSFWTTAINFEFLAEQGVIAREDLSLFKMVDTADEAWDVLRAAWDE